MAASSKAQGQTRSWDGNAAACNAGDFRACISISVTSQTSSTLPPGSTDVSVRVQNLQTASGLGGPWAILGWITLGGLSFDQTTFQDIGSPATATLQGAAGEFNVAASSGDYFGGLWNAIGNAGDPGGSITRQAQADDEGYVIGGCQTLIPGNFFTQPTTPRYGLDTGYFDTCGTSSSVVFDFVANSFEFTDNSFVEVFGEQRPDADMEDYKLGACTSGADCPTAAAPEPSTFVLLGSSFIGLAGVAYRRRRNQSGERLATA